MPERNFMFALLNAVNNDQNTEQWLQISDSNVTSQDAALEQDCYTSWNAALQRVSSEVQAQAANGGTSSNANPALTEAQSIYQTDSTLAQTNETCMDGATQSAQQAVGQDGTNLQNQAQLAQTLNSIGQQMSGMISHAYT